MDADNMPSSDICVTVMKGKTDDCSSWRLLSRTLPTQFLLLLKDIEVCVSIQCKSVVGLRARALCHFPTKFDVLYTENIDNVFALEQASYHL
jgi:hypothetical protein